MTDEKRTRCYDKTLHDKLMQTKETNTKSQEQIDMEKERVEAATTLQHTSCQKLNVWKGDENYVQIFPAVELPVEEEQEEEPDT